MTNNKIKAKFMRLKELADEAHSVLKEYGWRILFHKVINYIRYYVLRKITPETKRVVPADKILKDRFFNLQPMKSVKVDRDDFRLNVVTDSLDKTSLFGGVATALILAILYANKNNLTLRIITRETKNNPEDFEHFLKIHALKKPKNVEYFSDFDRDIKGNNMRLETSEKDIYLTTSWWSTYVTKEISSRGKIFYLLQEVETFFYPYGDENYLCGEILKDENINFIINSNYLNEYYKDNGYENIIKNSIYFEPAFTKKLYQPATNCFNKKEKYNLFFYARPKNPRNLFYYGLKLLDEAIKMGLINKEQWNIYFAGSALPRIRLSNDIEPEILGQMSWQEYSSFIKKVDLGFCLMYTPHPSYPPLDIVSSGGVVLTNKFMNKQSLDFYSKNIICKNLDTKSMMSGFAEAVGLATDNKLRLKNFESNNIEHDWQKILEPILEYIKKNI